VNADLLDVDGIADPPRRNGELIFEAPWQSRVFGLVPQSSRCASTVTANRFAGSSSRQSRPSRIARTGTLPDFIPAAEVGQ
jgi:hypothetical protein